MKYLSLITILIISTILSCTTEDTLFEKGTWWISHWQQVSDTSIVFSSGQKAIGGNEIVTPQFFISKNDTILENFHLENLVESNHKSRFKLIETSDNTFIKIQEIGEAQIEVSGPVQLIDELDSAVNEFIRLPAGIDSPIPDSILFDL